MKPGFFLIALAGLIVVVARMLHHDEPADADFTRPLNSSMQPAGPVGNDGASGNGVAPVYVLRQPDREMNLVDTDPLDETPPRTVAGLPAIKKSVELPVVDPNSLLIDPDAGRINVDDVKTRFVTPSGSKIDPAIDPLNAPDDQLIETDGGPLAGIIPTPDPTAPGPAIDLPSTDSTAVLDDALSIDTFDPSGPGTPVDPASAAATPPNFQLPGDGVSIPDPDSSAPRPDASN